MMTARHWPWVAGRNSCKEGFNRESRNADGPRATTFSVICIIHYLHYVGSRPVFSDYIFYPYARDNASGPVYFAAFQELLLGYNVGGDGILDLSFGDLNQSLNRHQNLCLLTCSSYCT
jgi:hypothetical protein